MTAIAKNKEINFNFLNVSKGEFAEMNFHKSNKAVMCQDELRDVFLI